MAEMMRATGAAAGMGGGGEADCLALGVGDEISPVGLPGFLNGLRVIFGFFFVLALANLVLIIIVGR
jgi:hypothetical protein